MPRYSYECPDCSTTVDVEDVPFEARRTPQPCHCGGFAEYQFPLEAVRGIAIQESYYDPSLGMDISGKREKAQALKALNLVESGDKVGGARNVEKDLGNNLVKPEAPKGVTLSTIQRRKERAAKEKLSKPTFAQTMLGERKVVPRPTKQGVRMKINDREVR